MDPHATDVLDGAGHFFFHLIFHRDGEARAAGASGPAMTARYVVRVSPADVGRRVSVRSRLASQVAEPPAAPGPTMTDTVGHLRSWRDGVLEIERPDGSLTRIAESDLVAGRVIPPAPPRRRARA